MSGQPGCTLFCWGILDFWQPRDPLGLCQGVQWVCQELGLGSCFGVGLSFPSCMLMVCALMAVSPCPQRDALRGVGLQWALRGWQGHHDRASGPRQEVHREQG